MSRYIAKAALRGANLIVGEAELERGEAIVKEMKSGTQRAVKLGELVEALLALGGRA